MTTVTLSDLPITDTDVLVVGAGPTGLMAGLVLARRGVQAVIIDAKPAPTQESRALAVQARTMEIYDQLGLAERVLAGAYPATRLQIRQDINPQGFNIETAQRGSTRYPGMQIFEQSRNEELLSSTLTETGNGVRWRHRLVDLLDHADGSDGSVGRIVALVDGPKGLTRIRARWCVGADGARSAVRRIQDLPFEGVTDDAMFCVADLRGVSGLPDGTIAARFGGATFALLFPLGPGGHARLISMVNSDEVHQESALATARAELGLSYTAVDWFSAYRVHHRVATRFRKGSVFLAGDAAHVHSPVGGQGMNTGLQDAHNLANLLADVVQGHVDSAALDRYEHERRPVAQRLVKVTDRVFSVIARRSRGSAWFRRRFSGVMATFVPRILDTPLGARFGGYLGQYRIRYHFTSTGSAVPGWATDRIVGLRLPPVGDNLSSLRTFTWQLHTYGARATRPDVPDWVDGPHDFGPDSQGRLRLNQVYLVRPDGYVAASLPLRGGVVDETTLLSALRAHQVLR